jgi:hypothetical protein
VTCENARQIANSFDQAVGKATQAEPDYTDVKAYGFTPPLYPSDIATFRSLLLARQDQLNQKAQSVDNGTCVDNPTASVIGADGKSVTLPIVYDSQPNDPINGSQSNADPRTIPVTVGTASNDKRTNTWTELDALYGKTTWYTNCVDNHLGMNWPTDVPKFEATEDQHDNRFILAVNVSSSLTDDQIRQKAADDGNPHVDKLPIVRAASIINTRNLGEERCDPFIDARSMIRVSLGKVVFNSDGSFKQLEQDKGAFVDCHNQWWLPKTQPVPTPTPTPSSTRTPTTTPSGPPSSPPTTCKNGGTPPQCLQPKDPSQGAVHQSNVPTFFTGTAPPPTTQEPKPSSPPKTYSPPPPPVVVTTTTPAPTRSIPSSETPAPQPSDPATGTACPPGMC